MFPSLFSLVLSNYKTENPVKPKSVRNKKDNKKNQKKTCGKTENI